MGLFATVWKYRVISDHRIAGQRFVIEEAYNDQGDGMGYDTRSMAWTLRRWCSTGRSWSRS